MKLALGILIALPCFALLLGAGAGLYTFLAQPVSTIGVSPIHDPPSGALLIPLMILFFLRMRRISK